MFSSFSTIVRALQEGQLDAATNSEDENTTGVVTPRSTARSVDGEEADDTGGESSGEATREAAAGPSGAETASPLQLGKLFSFANTLAASVQAKTNDFVTTVRETDWATEIEAFKKELQEDTNNVVHTVEGAVKLPDNARSADLHETFRSLQTHVGQIGHSLYVGTSDLIMQVNDAIHDEMEQQNALAGASRKNNRTSSANRFSGSAAKYSRFEAEVSAMQRDSSTYCDEPEDVDEYEAWLRNFDVAAKKGDIDEIVKGNAFMAELQARIVPLIVEFDEFWTRYFYRLHKLQQKHEQRTQLAQRAQQLAEEEVGWDDDEAVAEGTVSGSGEGWVGSGDEEGASSWSDNGVGAGAGGGAEEGQLLAGEGGEPQDGALSDGEGGKNCALEAASAEEEAEVASGLAGAEDEEGSKTSAEEEAEVASGLAGAEPEEGSEMPAEEEAEVASGLAGAEDEEGIETLVAGNAAPESEPKQPGPVSEVGDVGAAFNAEDAAAEASYKESDCGDSMASTTVKVCGPGQGSDEEGVDAVTASAVTESEGSNGSDPWCVVSTSTNAAEKGEDKEEQSGKAVESAAAGVAAMSLEGDAAPTTSVAMAESKADEGENVEREKEADEDIDLEELSGDDLGGSVGAESDVDEDWGLDD